MSIRGGFDDSVDTLIARVLEDLSLPDEGEGDDAMSSGDETGTEGGDEIDMDALMELVVAVGESAEEATPAQGRSALQRLAGAIAEENLDTMGEFLLIAACAGPIEVAGDASVIRDELYDFALMTYPLACAYAYTEAFSPVALVMRNLENDGMDVLTEHVPAAGMALLAFEGTAGTFEAALRYDGDLQNLMAVTEHIVVSLYGLASLSPAALTLLAMVSPPLAQAISVAEAVVRQQEEAARPAGPGTGRRPGRRRGGRRS